MLNRRRVATVLIAALAAVGLAGCGDDDGGEDTAVLDEDTQAETEDETGADSDIVDQTENVVADPEAFVGDEVTISGEVDRVYEDANAFLADVLAGPEVTGGGNQALTVLSAPDAAANVADGDSVQVSGVLQEFDPSLVAEELGIDELPEALGARLVPGDFVIIANDISTTG